MEGNVEVEEEGGEWELLHNNNNNEDDSLLFIGPPLDSIRPDHFSLHPQNSNSNSTSNSSSSEVDRNFDDSYVANQLFSNPNPNPNFHHHHWNSNDSGSDTNSVLVPDVDVEVEDEAEVDFESKVEEEEEEEEGERGKKEHDERRIVWWKVPFEVLKFWVNPLPLPLPVWSLSVAAAATFLGLFFLGRRLYKMKRKTQTLKLNLALDDKKVSQLMGRVARLNEAFSVVRRVPIVRPSLPASSVTLRPVMSMR